MEVGMAWFLNKYACTSCGAAWEDEWSCCCDDECPECGVDFSPYYSDDISAYTEESGEGSYIIYYSPPEAEHIPDYTFFAKVKQRRIAQALEELAKEMAFPA